jgi:hypothetical protein
LDCFVSCTSKKLTKKRISKLLNEGTTNGILGKHIFKIDQESIVEITENSETRSTQIQRIEETDKHIFIYISSLAAYIIPKRVFANSEEKNNFLNALDWFKREH